MVVQPAQNGNGKDVTMRLHSARMRRSFAEGYRGIQSPFVTEWWWRMQSHANPLATSCAMTPT